MSYNPSPRTEEALDRAYTLLRAVPYTVTARWLFYQLLQEGYYSKKKDYKNKFLPAVSKARHHYYKSWRPDTLADDTRDSTERGDGYDTTKDWIDAVQKYLACNLDKWAGQEYYVELWFEARAMRAQFEHYTKFITLRPMAGQPSIPFKYSIAQALNDKHYQYDLPIVILYFGDLDPAGSTIAEVVRRDVAKWCDVSFEFIFCGLDIDQVNDWNIPENPDHPGTYQWEALSDEGAQSIIEEWTEQYIDTYLVGKLKERGDQAGKQARDALKPIAEDWDE